MASKNIIFLVGATAVGKTDVALALSRHLPCEIVSCDSMQVYREISIATSKPSFVERKEVEHHLLDLVSVEEKFDVAMFNKAARSAVDAIAGKQKYSLVVGGSGMYMQVLLDGIFESQGQDIKLREKLEDLAEKQGVAALYQQLKDVDPQAASRIHVNDSRRIVRALEVFQMTKTPISQLQKKRSGFWGNFPVLVFGLERARSQLYQRINDRVEKMFSDGLLDEVKAIAARKLSLTACRIIGVSEVLEYLNGQRDLQQTKELIKQNTRRLAKRQLTWFRKDKRINWLAVDGKDSAEDVASRILKILRKA